MSSDRVIWKFDLGSAPITKIDLVDPVVRLVGISPERSACIWIEHTDDPSQRQSQLSVYVIGTGRPVPPDTEHVGSFIEGSFVWHVYTSLAP